MCSSTHQKLVRVQRTCPSNKASAIEDEQSFSEMDQATISEGVVPPLPSRPASRATIRLTILVLGLILFNPFTIDHCMNTRLSQSPPPMSLPDNELGNTTTTTTMYSIARTDRSGAAIHEMLFRVVAPEVAPDFWEMAPAGGGWRCGRGHHVFHDSIWNYVYMNKYF